MSAIAKQATMLQRAASRSQTCIHTPPKQQRRWTDVRARAGPEDMGDLDAALRADMERFQQKQTGAMATSAQASKPAAAAAEAGSNPFKETVDKVLIADFFFIMLSLAWLAAGLAEKAAFKSETLIGSWMPLWPMVFQPAIGVLMAGALVSGGIAWVQENWGKKE